jgi:hypothetical protein
MTLVRSVRLRDVLREGLAAIARCVAVCHRLGAQHRTVRERRRCSSAWPSGGFAEDGDEVVDGELGGGLAGDGFEGSAEAV